MVKNLPAMRETWVWALDLEDPLEKEQLPTAVFLPGEFHGRGAWRATVHGVARVGHDWVTYPILQAPMSWEALSIGLICPRAIYVHRLTFHMTIIPFLHRRCLSKVITQSFQIVDENVGKRHYWAFLKGGWHCRGKRTYCCQIGYISLGSATLSSQSCGFSSSHVWMWELDIKKADHHRIDAFELWCWRRLLRVPWLQGDPTSPS